jgi:hypothetical protein
MKHTLSRKLAAAGTVAVAAALCGAGLASASPSAAARSSGIEHFYLMTTQPSASRYSVIATGVFTTGGVDIQGSTTDTVRVKGGTFKIHHGAVHVIKEEVNSRSCLAQFEGTGRFTLGGGTGAYKKLSGSGKALISVLAIFSRNSKGVCNPNANAVVNEQTITATAHVRL